MIDPIAYREQGESILKYTWKLESEVNQWRAQFNEFCKTESIHLGKEAYQKWAKRGIPFIGGALGLGTLIGGLLVHWLKW